MSGRILYRGVTAVDAHPLALPTAGESKPKSRPPSTGEETLDPRIQDELEKLNKASEDINRLELQLNEARAKFRQTLTESTQMLNVQAKKLGACIEKARPYYDARMKAQEAHLATQNAAIRYERAIGQLAAAKEMVYLAEEGFFNKGQPFDPAWQEMLNHATIKVNDAETERYESQIEHQRTAQAFAEAEQRVKKYKNELRRSITKSKPYFEMKAKINQQMEEQKKHVGRLEDLVLSIKQHYAKTLSNLERISDEIHQQRRNTQINRHLGKRGEGVGAESPVSLVDTSSSSSPSPAASPTLISTSNADKNNTALWTESSQKTILDPLGSAPVSQITQRHVTEGRNERDEGQSSVPNNRHLSNGLVSEAKSDASIVSNSDLQSKVKESEMKDSWRSVKQGEVCVSGVVSDQYPGVVLRKPKTIHVVHQTYRTPRYPKVSSRTVSSPPEQRPGGKLPMVQVTAPSASAPTSPSKPDPSQDLEDVNVRDNAEIMDSIWRQKSRPFGLRPSRLSQDDLLEYSDTDSLSGSVASASMLDDDQIQSLMQEMGEYTKFLQQMDERQSKRWKRLSLPVKLTELKGSFNLEDFLTEARLDEEDIVVLGDGIAPIAVQEDDLSFEFVENVGNFEGQSNSDSCGGEEGYSLNSPAESKTDASN